MPSLTKFDLNSVSEYMRELTTWIAEKSEGEIRYTGIISNVKNGGHVVNSTIKRQAEEHLITALLSLADTSRENGTLDDWLIKICQNLANDFSKHFEGIEEESDQIDKPGKVKTPWPKPLENYDFKSVSSHVHKLSRHVKDRSDGIISITSIVSTEDDDHATYSTNADGMILDLTYALVAALPDNVGDEKLMAFIKQCRDDIESVETQ